MNCHGSVLGLNPRVIWPWHLSQYSLPGQIWLIINDWHGQHIFFLVNKVSFTRTTITFPIYLQNFILTDGHLNLLVKRVTKKPRMVANTNNQRCRMGLIQEDCETEIILVDISNCNTMTDHTRRFCFNKETLQTSKMNHT